MEVKIYTKICLQCVYGEMYNNTMTEMAKRGIVPEIIRTQYLPKAHEEATQIYGNENYIAFVQYGTEVIDFEKWIEFMNKPEEIEAKIIEEPVKAKVNIIKKKPTRGGKKK